MSLKILLTIKTFKNYTPFYIQLEKFYSNKKLFFLDPLVKKINPKVVLHFCLNVLLIIVISFNSCELNSQNSVINFHSFGFLKISGKKW
jgi:hypothetical protein